MNRIEVIHAYFQGRDKHSISIVHDEKIESYTIRAVLENKDLSEILYTGSESEIQISFPYTPCKRCFFVLEMNGQQLIFSHRILPLAGMYNVRDLGGYLTKDNKRISWNKLFRGDHLFNLKPEGRELLDEYRIKTIIDLRSTKEIVESPNPYIGQTYSVYSDPNAHIAAFAGMLQDADKGLSHKDILDNPQLATLNMSKANAKQQMINQQKSFVHNRDSVKAFQLVIETIVNEKSAPSFQHCRGGKDRTGYSVMLTMGLLNVKTSLLIEDYMLTAKARAHKNEQYYNEFKEMAKGNQNLVDYLYTFFDTQPEFINGAIKSIQQEYGDIKNYVKKVLHISDKDIQNMHNLYLSENDMSELYALL